MLRLELQLVTAVVLLTVFLIRGVLDPAQPLWVRIASGLVGLAGIVTLVTYVLDLLIERLIVHA